MAGETMNINDEVKVRLTPEGEDVWMEYQDRLGVPRSLPGVDRAGKQTVYLWELMQILGPETYHGMPRPLLVNNEIEINGN